MSSPQRQSGRAARLLSIEEAAEFFSVNQKTVRRWIAAGQLVAYKLGRQWRIPPDEIERFLATRSSWKRGFVS
jgi:excisionase family DNA binding protein